MPLYRNVLNRISFRVKLYLIVIALLLILLCVYERTFIIPAILLYVLLLTYTFWSNGKRKDELYKHLEELTLDVDSIAKNSLVNSPLPLSIIRYGWKSNMEK